MNTPKNSALTEAQRQQFERDGYLVVGGLFDAHEISALREHFMALHEAGPVPGYFNPKPLQETGGDLLAHYPRMLHPHRFDETSKRYLLDARLQSVLRELLGEEPLAAQSMFYFKPPGARGQALHQDDFYLKTAPGSCLAAWVSLDKADRENGGLFMVPGSHQTPLQCPHPADLSQSFTIEEVDVPQGLETVPVDLEPGEVLFFNGSMIHGSTPNSSAERFRRSFICHYVPQSTSEMSKWYQMLDFAGREIGRGTLEEGGPCGTEALETMRQSAIAQGALAGVGLDQGAIAI